MIMNRIFVIIKRPNPYSPKVSKNSKYISKHISKHRYINIYLFIVFFLNRRLIKNYKKKENKKNKKEALLTQAIKKRGKAP